MFYTPPGDLRNRLAARLAEKTGQSEEQAHKFLEALSDLTPEEESDESHPLGSVRGHTISIPLVEREDGTITVDVSGYSALTPFTRPKPTPEQKPSVIPPVTPVKPSRPPGRPPGAYPGPSVFIRVNDWLGEDRELGEGALEKLREAVRKSGASASGDPLRFTSSGREKLEQK
jgi:hypothetical protein